QHTYLEELTVQPFSVTVSDIGGAFTGPVAGSITVTDAALSGSLSVPTTAVEGRPFSGVVFHFTDADPNGTASDYSAVVVLGDGNTVTLTSVASASGQVVVSSGGGFDVVLQHTYLEELTSQPFSVTISDVGGASSGPSGGTITVADAALS